MKKFLGIDFRLAYMWSGHQLRRPYILALPINGQKLLSFSSLAQVSISGAGTWRKNEQKVYS